VENLYAKDIGSVAQPSRMASLAPELAGIADTMAEQIVARSGLMGS